MPVVRKLPLHLAVAGCGRSFDLVATLSALSGICDVLLPAKSTSFYGFCDPLWISEPQLFIVPFLGGGEIGRDELDRNI